MNSEGKFKIRQLFTHDEIYEILNKNGIYYIEQVERTLVCDLHRMFNEDKNYSDKPISEQLLIFNGFLHSLKSFRKGFNEGAK